MGPGSSWNVFGGSPPVQYTSQQVGFPNITAEELGHYLAAGAVGLYFGGLASGASFVTAGTHWYLHNRGESVWDRLDNAVNPPSPEEVVGPLETQSPPPPLRFWPPVGLRQFKSAFESTSQRRRKRRKIQYR